MHASTSLKSDLLFIDVRESRTLDRGAIQARSTEESVIRYN
jgi:hypothetical protein